MKKATPSAGFTLIELSIVLVIIGLIVGGILVGNDLIRAARLRTVTKQMHEFATALNTFKLKYNALPGDMSNPTSFFAPTSADAPAGNNDGIIGLYSAEEYGAWQMLASAGLIGGGPYPFCYCNEPVPGTNIPGSKLSAQIGWMIFQGDGAYYYQNSFNNLQLMLGATNPADTGGRVTAGALAGADAKFIDLKIDDGMPGTGRVRGGSDYYTATLCWTSGAGVNSYNITSTGLICRQTYFID